MTNRAELLATLRDRLGEQSSAAWLAALDAADIPAGPINDIPTAFASEQAVARRMAVSVEHPVLGTTTQVGLPFELSATPAEIRMPPPLLGEHADEILAEAGYQAAEIAALRADGVI